MSKKSSFITSTLTIQAHWKKFISDNNETGIEVELKDLKNLLHDVVIEDLVTTACIPTQDGYETEITEFISDRLLQKINEFNQKGILQPKGKSFTPISISDEGLELIELVAVDCENYEGAWHSSTEIKIDKLGYVIKDGVKTKTFWDGKIISKKQPKRIKIRNISGDETVKKIVMPYLFNCLKEIRDNFDQGSINSYGELVMP